MAIKIELCLAAVVCLISSVAGQAVFCSYNFNRQVSATNIREGPINVNTISECCTLCRNDRQCTGFNYAFNPANPVNDTAAKFCTTYTDQAYSPTFLSGNHFGYIASRLPTPVQTTDVQTTDVQTTDVQTTGAGNVVLTGGFTTTPIDNNPTNFVSCIGGREASTDYWVPNIGARTYYNSEAECCAHCDATAGCNAYTWTVTDGSCYAHPYRGSPHGSTFVNSGYRITAPDQQFGAATGFLCTTATREPGIDYWGPNLAQTMTETEADCCNVCQVYQGCGAYSWQTTGTPGQGAYGVCYIKPYASNRHITGDNSVNSAFYRQPVTTQTAATKK